jgi:NADH-quinone oxidoreductase subunit G
VNDPAPQVAVELNGEQKKFAPGTRLIDACKQVGVDVPHFCYHPHLSIAGNCRMCAVEIEGQRGLPISCNTIVAEGMKVKTESDRVKAARQSVMEFLLVNHPIDCPICDQAGECKLQMYYMEHDLKPSRLEVEKVHYDKRVPVGSRVVLDQERCVECTRCIRFCDEVTKTGELRMSNRGDRNVITTFPGVPLENNYSVNTADLCPVGALTQRDFRFQARVWFLKSNATVCPGCAKGCNVNVDYYHHDIVTDHNGKAYRLRPRQNDAVNKSWMCDFGRDEYRAINDGRLLGASLRGEARPIDVVAADARSELLKWGRNALIVTSFDATVEEMAQLRRFARETLGGATIAAVPIRADGLRDDLLIRADKHPNRKGAEWLGLATGFDRLPELLKNRPAVLLHRFDLALDADGRVRAALEAAGVRVVVAANESSTTALATHLLPGASFIEREGTWVNEDGRIQRVKRAYRPRKGTLDDLAAIATLSGGRLAAEARAVFDGLGAEYKQFLGVHWDDLGPTGALAAPATAGAAV